MILNKIRHEVNGSGGFLNHGAGSVRALQDYTTILELVSPLPIDTSVMAAFILYDSRDITLPLFMFPTGKKGNQVSENPEVANWNVWEVAIDKTILSAIGRYIGGRVGLTYSFRDRVTTGKALVYRGHFSKEEDLPLENNIIGDYYVCDRYNITVGNVIYTYGDNALWNGEAWVRDRNYRILMTTSTIPVPVDPAFVANIPDVPEQDIADIIAKWGAIVATAVRSIEIAPSYTIVGDAVVSETKATIELEVKINPSDNLITISENGIKVSETAIDGKIDDKISEHNSETAAHPAIRNAITAGDNVTLNNAKDYADSKDLEVKEEVEDYADDKISEHNESQTAHQDIRLELEEKLDKDYSGYAERETLSINDLMIVRFGSTTYRVSVNKLVSLISTATRRPSLVFNDNNQVSSWLNGTYVRPDGISKDDLTIGQSILTISQTDNDYWVSELPVNLISDLTPFSESIDLSNYYNKDEIDLIVDGLNGVINGKVDKVTANDGVIRAYIKNTNGTQTTIIVSEEDVPFSLVKRRQNGLITIKRGSWSSLPKENMKVGDLFFDTNTKRLVVVTDIVGSTVGYKMLDTSVTDGETISRDENDELVAINVEIWGFEE